MKAQIFLAKIKTLLKKIPHNKWALAGYSFGVLAIGYGLIFFVPKSVEFSYAGQTCARQLLLAPDVQRASSDAFDISIEDTVRLGSVGLFSTKVCVEPKTTPEEGVVTASIAPFGSFVAAKQFAIEVPAAPVANAQDIVGKKISASTPLTIQLTTADVIHQYSLKIADKQTACIQAVATLSCDIPRLELAHGESYTAALYQSYRDSRTKVLEGKVETLEPLILQDSSLKDGQVVYDAPTALTLVFDQPVDAVTTALMKGEGDTAEPIDTEVSVDGAQATVSFGALAREETYRLTVKNATGTNGSSIAEAIGIGFTTSGGPKVASVSIGSTSVARNATITLTFDQPIAESVDVAQFVRAEGVAASVRKISATQAAVAIQGGDCTPFTLVADKGITSGVNGEASKEAWRYASRTICGSSWTIGSSVQGRAIVAYSFGSGGNVILFTGGIHGSERSGYTTMQALVQYLQANGNSVPADKRIVIVPNANPDGIAAGSRYNVNNVNLGRNFPTANWSPSIETSSGVLPTGGGTAPGSEPEAAALITLVRQLRPRLAISYHAQGSLVGANKFADSVAIGDVYAGTVGYRTMYYNAEAVMGYAMTGELEDWVGEEMNIPAILIELPSHSGNYLNSHLTAIKKMFAV